MQPVEESWTFWLLIFLPIVPVLLLVIAYRAMLASKRDELQKRLSGAPAEKYQAAFGNLERAFNSYYSNSAYAAALVGLAGASAIVVILAITHYGMWPTGPSAALLGRMGRVTSLALAGASGAYLYGLYELIGRYKTRDLYPSAIHQLWLGILVGAILGPQFGRAVASSGSVLAAFAVGALPLKDIWEWIRSKSPSANVRSASADSGIQLLQGTTTSLLERLEEQGIDSAEALAFADPVRMLITTNLEWVLILDLIDQALLVNYVGSSIASLRRIGVRGSIEMATIDQRLVDPESTAGELQSAQALLEKIAALLDTTSEVARNLSWQLNNDPLVEFIWTYWSANLELATDD